jgi:hypothetical protein
VDGRSALKSSKEIEQIKWSKTNGVKTNGANKLEWSEVEKLFVKVRMVRMAE